MRSELIDGRHLARRAVIYIRQSTPHQVLTNQESLRLQYDLRRRALDLGWRQEDIEVIDSDLGLSGAAAAHRAGFKDLIARVTLGQVGIVLSSEVTRLSRNCTDWYPLLDLCGYRQCLIGDREGVYDPASANGRLLLGLKGRISEVELHTIRARLTAGLLNKAERGELGLMLPVGLVRDAAGIVVKDPDREVQARLELVFATFLRLRSAAKVLRSLNEGGLALLHGRSTAVPAATRWSCNTRAARATSATTCASSTARPCASTSRPARSMRRRSTHSSGRSRRPSSTPTRGRWRPGARRTRRCCAPRRSRSSGCATGRRWPNGNTTRSIRTTVWSRPNWNAAGKRRCATCGRPRRRWTRRVRGSAKPPFRSTTGCGRRSPTPVGDSPSYGTARP